MAIIKLLEGVASKRQEILKWLIPSNEGMARFVVASVSAADGCGRVETMASPLAAMTIKKAKRVIRLRMLLIRMLVDMRLISKAAFASVLFYRTGFCKKRDAFTYVPIQALGGLYGNAFNAPQTGRISALFHSLRNFQVSDQTTA